MKKSEELVRIEEEFACASTDLWAAIVEPERMRQWFFADIPDFRPEPGFYTEFMVDAGERQFLHQWEVTEVELGTRIAYRWRYAGYAGAAQSVFEVSGDAQHSKLRLSFPVEEDFPDDIPEFERAACVGGWEYFTGELKRYLET